MGDFRKKNILQTDFDGEKYLARKYLTQKMPCTEKKMSLMLHRLHVWGKPKTKSSILAPPPPPPSSNVNRIFLQRNSFVCLTAPNAYQQGQ